MTKISLKKWAAAAAITLATTGLSATAAAWEPYDASADAKPTAIVTATDAGSSILLACGKGGKISALISTSDTPITDLLARNAPYSRGETVTLKFGDKPAIESRMRWIPAAELLETRSSLVGAKLFNASIRGETVSIDVPREPTFTLALPTPNASFKAFATACSAARAG